MQANKPTTHQGDLTKLPRALAPLVERPQWAVWRWTQQPNGRWQKPPYQALDPQRHASTKDPGTWSDYATALAAVQAGKADGISYVLTEADPFAAIDLDHCRHPDTHSIDVWAQNFLDVARHTYAEVTPSGAGCRIWGLTGDDTAPVNRKFTLEIDGKQIAAELFRRTPKALTVTGYRLDTDPGADQSRSRRSSWAIAWGERRKAAAAAEAAATQINGHSFNGGGPGHDIDHIERIVREGRWAAPIAVTRFTRSSAITSAAAGASSRSTNTCSNSRTASPADTSARAGFPREIARSASKYSDRALPLLDGWKAPEKIVEARETPSRETDHPEPTSPEHRIPMTTAFLSSSRHCPSRRRRDLGRRP